MPIPKQLVCDCLRCGHAWVKRIGTVPKRCPKCKNRYWNVPKGRLRMGRPRKKGKR